MTPDELARHSAVFLPSDPPRAGRIAFWSPEGTPDGATRGAPDGGTPTAGAGRTHERPTEAPTDVSMDKLTVVADDVRPHTVPALLLPVREALPALTRARFSTKTSPAAAFWGAATLFALHLAAKGLLLPGLTGTDRDAWRAGPLGREELAELRALAASMPPSAHAVPLAQEGELLLPEPEALLRAFVDAVVDGLPRTPAAPLAAGGPAFAADAPQELPEQRAWAADVAAGHDAGVRLSLRVELPGLTTQEAPAFRAVLQMHSVSDPALVADAAEVWAGSG
ncbi:ATP-dependent helicase, partial [Streptomyces sp. ISL-36]|nr:ATP-dependent helicase [Streptomyces sp. ISL-36]